MNVIRAAVLSLALMGVAQPALGAPTRGLFSQTPGAPVPVGSQPFGVVTGDFNGDGTPDLAVTNFSSNTVTVLLGNGGGAFRAAPGSPIPVGPGPAGLAAGDFNRDGRPDLVVTNQLGNTITVLLGNGAGGFANAPGSPVPVGSLPFGIAVGDFNGDGRQDVVVANQGSNNISVLLGNGDGTFSNAPGSPVPVGLLPTNIATGDFTGDGRQDLAVGNQGDGTVSILLGGGNGSFSNASAYGRGATGAAGSGSRRLSSRGRLRRPRRLGRWRPSVRRLGPAAPGSTPKSGDRRSL